MKARFGFIGREEIDLAKEELVSAYRFDDGSFMKKSLWFEKPHIGNYVRGCAYDDVEELLEYGLDIFEDIESVDNFIKENDYSFSDDDLNKIKNIIKNGKVAYMLDGEIDDDKSFLIFNKLEDGQYMWKGTVEDAYNELDEWEGWDDMNNHTELLVMGLLQ